MFDGRDQLVFARRCWPTFERQEPLEIASTKPATGDKAAGTDVTRSEAERAGATITEIEGSRVIMVSQPPAVTDVLEAVKAVG